MDVKIRILEAAAAILSTSTEADFSTRAVCEAAGVGAPAIYRQFGDKEGLLAAAVDFGFEQYLAAKRRATYSDDPVQDLRDGWDNHVAFAVKNPNYYRLMYSPGLTTRPEAAAEAYSLLHAVVERAAVAGRLKVNSTLAAQMIMAANVGVALSLLYRSELSSAPTLSGAVRDAVILSVTTPAPTASVPNNATSTAIPTAASTLAAQLRETASKRLTHGESTLLFELLERLADPDPVLNPNKPNN